IPPAIARFFSRSPAQMLLLSIITSISATIIGLSASMHYDIATGPAIVISLGALFAITQALPSRNL
ncbi:MAG: hypothetical protein FXV79_01605, partial [Candidatus Thioglobus sp.]